MTNDLTEEEQARVLAYADKALSSAEMAETRIWIEERPAAQWLLAEFERSALPFAEAMSPMLDIAAPAVVASQLSTSVGYSPVKGNRPWFRAVAATVLLGAGIAIGMVAQNVSGTSAHLPGARLPGAPENWIAQVANYQQLYVRPTVDAAGPIDHAALSAMIEDNLQQPLRIPDFSDHNITFRRGQLLQVEGNPLIQLAYLPDNGLPIAFCIMKESDAEAGQESNDGQDYQAGKFEAGTSHGLHYRSWRSNGLRFVLLGKAPDKQIGELSEIARRLNKAA